RSVLFRIQTPMVKGFAFVGADCFSVGRSAGEHQRRFWCGMASKDGEHDALIFRTEVEKAVPCQNAVKMPIQRELTHVGNEPVSLGKTALADFDEFCRGVRASQIVALLDEVAGNRLGGAAPNVENGSSGR